MLVIMQGSLKLIQQVFARPLRLKTPNRKHKSMQLKKKLIGVALAGITLVSVMTAGGNAVNASTVDLDAIAQADLTTTQNAITAAFPDVQFAGSASTSSRSGYNEKEDRQKIVQSLLAKATPDECFAGVGVNYPVADPTCPEGSQPKTNQSYVWGMTQTNNTIWFGTGANVQCLVGGAYLQQSSPTLNADAVCEMGQSMGSRLASVPAAFGDTRPPHAFRYDQKAKTNVDLTTGLTGADLGRLRATIGFRAAGTNGKVVYFAGPGMTGVNLFAFNASTSAFLGSTTLAEYTNIRAWLRNGDQLYTGVANRTGGGSVLRFNGTIEAPFAFDIVGENIDGEVANLAIHKSAFM